MNIIKRIKLWRLDRTIDAMKHGSGVGGYLNQRTMREALRKLLAAGRLSPDEYVKYLMHTDYGIIEDVNERGIIIFGLELLKEELI